MKSHRILAAAFVLFTLSACAESPTVSSRACGSTADQECRSVNSGGFTIGSGDGGAGSGGFIGGSENETELQTTTSSTTTSDESSTGRSGYTMGSGN